MNLEIPGNIDKLKSSHRINVKTSKPDSSSSSFVGEESGDHVNKLSQTQDSNDFNLLTPSRRSRS